MYTDFLNHMLVLFIFLKEKARSASPGSRAAGRECEFKVRLLGEDEIEVAAGGGGSDSGQRESKHIGSCP